MFRGELGGGGGGEGGGMALGKQGLGTSGPPGFDDKESRVCAEPSYRILCPNEKDCYGMI